MQRSGQIILVVDDYRDTADLISEVLELDGFVARTAYTSLDAVRLYDALKPALVITDESLSGTVTGSDLLRTLRRKYGPEVVGRALFLTGLPKQVSALPTDLVLEKPIGCETLLAAVHTLLGPTAAREAY
jgi:DNA-binding response OmpR family regulator